MFFNWSHDSNQQPQGCNSEHGCQYRTIHTVSVEKRFVSHRGIILG